VAAALALLLASACNRVDAESRGDAEGGSDATLEATGSATGEAPFEWPHAEPHPRLRIAIEDGPVRGTIEIELMPELAPWSVLRISDLARNGYYDGTTFHRVIPGFMIQGGDPNSRDRDPTNDGYGDSDVRLDDEFGDAPFVRGVVGLGNTGRPDSTGAQLFIMLADQRNLDGRYTAIGRVVSGMDVVDAIAGVEIDAAGRWGPKNRPIENVVLSEVTVAAPAPTPAAPLPEGREPPESGD
jgi:cyclophilin family peptidyl-prolyl cis-trans isomerase